ncbi:MAG TPA: L,D-transpeptidase [Candidatus Binataceae bacterium]|nr:L,D-transpeptidase [Candidatus Binataceae bacterium]
MKMVFRLLVAILVLFVLAPVASARVRHHSHPKPAQPQTGEQNLPEMTIIDEWSPDLIVAPPVTRPSGSVYDTPKPPSASFAGLAPAPVQNGVSSAPTTGNLTSAAGVFPTHNEVPTGANPTGENSEPATTSSMQMVTATVDGARIDGAAITAPQAGTRTASLIAPSPPNQKNGAVCPLPSRTPGSILFDQTHDDSALNPANWSVSVFKHRQALIVYYKGRLFKQYDAVFGRALDMGAKQWAQDRRTPEGVYTIIEKYPSMRFRWFLRLNYPNLVDRVRYETERVNGVVPVDGDGKSPTVGSAIGIHGTDVPILNAGHINWTTGCISVNNGDIDSLERLLPVGTVVIIKP